MKRYTLSLISAFSLAASPLFAQFNTVTQHNHLYKVKQSPTPLDVNKKEASPESDTSNTAATNATDTFINSSADISLPTMALPLKNIHITSPFGWRRDPFVRNKQSFHSGVDLRANYEPVYSMLPGVVTKCGYDNRSGNFVTIQHGNIAISYCHLSKIFVKQGASVYAGTPVARSGNTGRSTGVHLHISCRLQGTHIDVAPLLKIIQSRL